MPPGGSRTARSRRLTRRERPPPAATLASSCSTSHCPFPTVLYSSVLRMPPRRTACQTWAHSLSGTDRRRGARQRERVPLLSQLAMNAQWATVPHPDEQVRAAVPATEGEAAAGNVTRVRHVHRCVVPRSSGQWQSQLVLDEWVAFSVLQRQPAQPSTIDITLARQSMARGPAQHVRREHLRSCWYKMKSFKASVVR